LSEGRGGRARARFSEPGASYAGAGLA